MGGSLRYIIPSIIGVLLIVIILENKFLPRQLLGSVYSIGELEEKYDKVKVGDTIDYEIKGYNNWQVIGKDDYNGTIDVVSKTDTEDLTLEPYQEKSYYENKLQETAEKYIDNKYAVSARSVNKADLDYFAYDTDFWLNNITEEKITTSTGSWKYDYNNLKNYKIYIIPFVSKQFDNMDSYNVGDIIEYSNNGVDRWVVVEHGYVAEEGKGACLVLIPETPIELVIESIDDDIPAKVDQIINSFNNDVWRNGNYVGWQNLSILKTLLSTFLIQQTERIYFYNYSCYGRENNELKFSCGGLPYYENGDFGNQMGTFYTDTNPYTLGYRPVVTLKVSNKKVEEKELSSKLKVGDNVKYSAKNYNNWKVLSIDEDAGTVDIISGGIVKNLTLSGKEDWDNFEDIIQKEVDAYKNGNKSKKATTVTSSHLKTLKEIDKSILSRYWILSKNTYIKNSFSLSDKNGDLVYYNIGVMNLYENDNFDIYINNIVIYADLKGNQEVVEYYNDGYYTDYINQSSYTAGLRPVITLKLNSVEKLSEEDTKKIEEITTKHEKLYIKEQESKNKNYKEPKTVDDTSSRGTKQDNNTKDITKSNETTDANKTQEEKIIEKTVYKDRPLYKYGFFILLITCIIETILLIISKKSKPKY